MARLFYIFLLLASITTGYSQNKIDRPKLVVGIVVDQMRQEYLLRYYEKFGDGGFRKLMSEGFMLRNAHYNYVPTYTGPGHASIFSGTTPNVHGIIANNWYDRNYGRAINCVEDTSVSVVGGDESFGKFSPVNLRAHTITDELKIFTQNRAKVIGVSLKNRGAILPAGHVANAAYWFDEETFNFVSSTYYMTDLPDWVKKFNQMKLVNNYLKGKWETVLPVSEYNESGPDDTNYELIWEGRDKPTFPYDFKQLSKNNSKINLFKNSPFGDELLNQLAIEAISSESLGTDDITDFLTISYSSTDRVGHKFGPNSVEIEDTYLRLDRLLKDLFENLDQTVGEGNYLAFLTTDHGVADVPRYLSNQKLPAWYIKTKTLQENVQAYLVDKYGSGEWLIYAGNEQVYLNKTLISEQNVDFDEMCNYLADYLADQKGIRYAIPASQLHESSLLLNLIKPSALGYYPERSGDILLVWEPGWIPDEDYYFDYGSRHGSHFTYDSHVPLLFYGWGIKKGSSVRYHPITDIAPTLSMLLNIRLPNAATGQPIVELFED